ncbi:MAG: hypothetical protein NXI10_17800 [bacterium]|nr:hypothetical protein [bacterium]
MIESHLQQSFHCKLNRPYGMVMYGRNGVAQPSDNHRYGFNGMEKDDELKGNGNSYDFGARLHDPRVGRWLSIDPLAAKYPSMSPYNFVGNTPTIAIDPNGKEIIIQLTATGAGSGQVKYEYKANRSYENVENPFLRETYRALDKMYSGGLGEHYADVVQEVANCEDVTIGILGKTDFTHDSDTYGPHSDKYEAVGVIYWHPFSATEVGQPDEETGETRQSAAVGLGHEMNHAVRHFQALLVLNQYIEAQEALGVSEAEYKNYQEFKDLQVALHQAAFPLEAGNEVEEDIVSSMEKGSGEGWKANHDDVVKVYKAENSTSLEESSDISKKERKQIEKLNKDINGD